jgi:hypothetical protein
MRVLIATIIALVASSSAFASPGRPHSVLQSRGSIERNKPINQYPTFKGIEIPPELEKKWGDEYNRIQKAVLTGDPKHAKERLQEHMPELKALQDEMKEWDLHTAHS